MNETIISFSIRLLHIFIKKYIKFQQAPGQLPIHQVPAQQVPVQQHMPMHQVPPQQRQGHEHPQQLLNPANIVQEKAYVKMT